MNIPTNKSDWPPGHFSNDLRLMAATITELELWDWFKEENPPADEGYSWWGHPNINKISEILNRWDLEFAIIGKTNLTGKYNVYDNDVLLYSECVKINQKKRNS